MKNRLITILCCVLTVAGIITLVYGLSAVTREKSGDVRFGDFFAEKEYDVVFLGSDDMANGVFPMELWGKNGITSYNLGTKDCGIEVSYYLLAEAVKEAEIDTVVLDMYGISRDYSLVRTDKALHEALDPWPNNINKLKASIDLKGSTELFFTYPLYHERWGELSANDFKPSKSKTKGAEFLFGIGEPEQNEVINSAEDNSEALEYFSKIVDICNKKNIKLIPVYLPVASVNYDTRDVYLADSASKSMGLTLMDLSKLDTIVEKIDFNPETGRLNYSGGYKVTEYFEAYFREEGIYTDKREDEKYTSWNEAYMDYKEYKAELIRNTENVYDLFSLIDDDDYNVNIVFSDIYPIKADLLKEQFTDLGVNEELPYEDVFRLLIYNGKYIQHFPIEFDDTDRQYPTMRVQVKDASAHEVIDIIRVYCDFDTTEEGEISITSSYFVRGEVIEGTDN